MDIRIREVTNGYLVKVGCKFFVFADREGLMKELSEYFTDKKKKIKEYEVKYPDLGAILEAPVLFNPVDPQDEMTDSL